nr:hypothetical protein [Acidocella sp. C78]
MFRLGISENHGFVALFAVPARFPLTARLARCLWRVEPVEPVEQGR